MPKALTYEQIRDYINGESESQCRMLTTKLEFEEEKIKQNKSNSNVKIKICCNQGHIFLRTYGAFTINNKCPICNKKLNNDSRILKYEDVKSFIEQEGYKLLSSEYKCAKDYLKVECPHGHQYNVRYYNFYSGKRCPECAIEESRQRYNMNFETVKKYIEIDSKTGYKLLSTEYINNRTKLKMQCDKGHVFEMRYDNFKNQHQRCDICLKESQIGNATINKHLRGFTLDWSKQVLKDGNYTCILTGAHHKLNVHHIDSFNKIVNSIMTKFNLSKTQLWRDIPINIRNQIEKEITQIHANLKGIIMTKEIHNLFHRIYLYDNNIDQFIEFIKRLENGEFNKFLIEKKLILNINYEILNKTIKDISR